MFKLKLPIQISFFFYLDIGFYQGAIGEASEDVTQIVKVMNLGGQKWSWLIEHLVEFTSAGSVLVSIVKYKYKFSKFF